MAGEPDRKAVKRRWVLAAVGWLVILGGLAAMFFPLFMPASDRFPPSPLSDFKQVGLCLIMYSGDADDRLPPADRWMDAAMPYCMNSHMFHSRGVSENDPGGKPLFGIAFRRSLAGVNLSKLERPDKVAMIFDSIDLKWNAAGELDLLPNPPRHKKDGKRTNIICFADGRARQVSGSPGPVR